MAVITISRQYGCGGEYVAERVAEQLKFRLFNKELVKFAAILSGSDEDKIKMFDEEEHSTVRSFMSKYFDVNMFSDLFSTTDYTPKTLKQMMSEEHEAFFQTYGSQENITDAEAFQNMVRKIINKAADQMNAVILGRGGVCILEDHPAALHFRLVAKMEDRIKWVAMREELSDKDAHEKIKDVDNRKRKYFKHYFDRSIDDHWMYNGILNLSKIEITEASLAIVDIAKTKFKL
ncbi:MAG: cytidylate kinase-like family protein [Denitrovibrio sp.]|nr:MAG: cytidylate kinase-like family protein [Denitrovibrio sp.]